MVEGVEWNCLNPFTATGYFRAADKFEHLPYVKCSVDGVEYVLAVYCPSGETEIFSGKYIYRLIGLDKKSNSLNVVEVKK